MVEAGNLAADRTETSIGGGGGGLFHAKTDIDTLRLLSLSLSSYPRHGYTQAYAQQRSGRADAGAAFIIGISISVTFDRSVNANEVWSRD